MVFFYCFNYDIIFIWMIGKVNKKKVKKIIAILMLIINCMIGFYFSMYLFVIFLGSLFSYPLQGLSLGNDVEESFILFFLEIFVELLKFFIIPGIVFVFNFLFIKKNI